jgi:hypothetical protein
MRWATSPNMMTSPEAGDWKVTIIRKTSVVSADYTDYADDAIRPSNAPIHLR